MREKVERYLGLVGAIALLVISLLPSKPRNDWPLASKATHLDNGRLTRFVFDRNSYPDLDREFFLLATHVLNSCAKDSSCQGPRGYLDVAGGWRHIIDLYKPELSNLLANHERLPEDDPRKAVLGAQVANGVLEYVNKVHSNLAVKIYGLHVLLLAVVGLIVGLRQQVGAAFLSPLGWFGLAASAAKRVHDRV